MLEQKFPSLLHNAQLLGQNTIHRELEPGRRGLFYLLLLGINTKHREFLASALRAQRRRKRCAPTLFLAISLYKHYTQNFKTTPRNAGSLTYTKNSINIIHRSLKHVRAKELGFEITPHKHYIWNVRTCIKKYVTPWI